MAKDSTKDQASDVDEQPKAKAKAKKEPTHYVVTATQVRMPGTEEHAKSGAVHPVNAFGDMLKVHLDRQAIRPATAEEVDEYEAANAE